MRCRYLLLSSVSLCAGVILTAGCARPQRTENQSAAIYAPRDLKIGDTGSGGDTSWPSGGGAGSSGAAGIEFSRIGGPPDRPVVGPAPPGRMAPVDSSGSGTGDAGIPIPPDQDLQQALPK